MRSLLAISAIVCLGCEAVPDITYDSGASFDGPLPEGNTCPDLVPAYATACCKFIPCFGATDATVGGNCVATCADCQICSPLDLCCPNSQNHAVCKASLLCP